MAVTAATRNSIIQLVVTAYNAAPGTALLTQLVEASDGGASLADIATTLTTSSTFKAIYPTFQTSTEFATEFLGNLVPEASAEALAEGISVVESVLNGGGTRADVILQAATYLAALSESDPSFGSSAALFNNKVEVATYHTVTLELDSESIATLQSTLATVTSSDDSVTAAKAAADSTANPPTAGQTFTLTTSLNTITGTAGDDTISGGVGTIDSDNITGGAGSDTLALTLSNADDNNAAFAMTGVETFQARTTGAVALDLGDVTGVETIVANRLAGALTLNDVQDIANIQIDRNSSNANLDVNYESTVSSGTSDSVTITVSNSSDVGTVELDGIETVNFVSADAPTGTAGNEIRIDNAGTGTATEVLNISGETSTVEATDALTINSSATGNVTLTATAATSVTHTGSGALSVTVGSGVAATVTAADATGTLSATANGAANLTITGSANSDTVNMLATLTAADVLNGGDGADTLIVDNAGGALTAIPASAQISNFETLRLEATDDSGVDAFTLDANVASFSNIIIDVSDENDTYTLTDVTSESISIVESANNVIDLIDVSLADATGSADSLSLTVTNNDASTAFTVDDIASSGGGIESLTLNLVQGRDLTGVDINVDDISSSHSSGLTLTGDADAKLGTDVGLTIRTISAADYTGDLTLVLGSAVHAITTGAGADTITFGTTLGSTDNANGGAGADAMSATPAASQVTGATLSNIETGTFAFTNTASTVSFANVTGMSTVNLTGTEAHRLTNLTSGVSHINLAATDADGGETVSILFGSTSPDALTIEIGDTIDGTATADVDLDAVTTNYAGALTLISDGSDTGTNTINGLDANSATSLTMVLDNDLSITGGGDDDISANAATSVSITTNQGVLTIDDDLILNNAASTTLTAANGAIVITDALDISTAGGTLVLNASGGDSNDITIGDLQYDDMTSLTATASGGADITVTDITTFTGTSTTGGALDTSINLNATGSGTIVTISDIGLGSGATLDAVNITTSDSGKVSFTVTDNDTTITTIDATNSAASLSSGDALVIDVNDLAAATTIRLGTGDATVTTSDNADTVYGGGGAATIIITDGADTLYLSTGTERIQAQQVDDDVQINGFTAGTGGDVINLDISVLATENGSSVAVDTTFTPVIEDFATTDALSAANAMTNIIRITDPVANLAAVDTALTNDILDDGSFTAGDDIIVLWTDGANAHIAIFDITTLDTGADGVDAVAGTEIATLVGVDVNSLNASNFTWVA
jgi:hypothetical protein